MLTKELASALSKYLPRNGKLAQAMRYSVFAGGKRFRPRLCFAAAKALGKNPRKVLPIACAIELIHTFTLIHDDLPAMDNSDYRRGELTCHKKFNEATAILAGDALTTVAFEILARETGNTQVVSEVGRALLEVILGQEDDKSSEGKKLSLAALKFIHKRKTAALLKACVRSVAVYLKATKKQLKALTDYAEHLGLAFQIADDILDATSSRKKLGKPVKADLKKGFPYLIGIEKSKKLAEQEKNRAIAVLKVFGAKAEALRQIAKFVVERQK
ncbi:polyprenyl synthetase family protein [Candidatus Margulisiibacteriota bacterium]